MNRCPPRLPALVSIALGALLVLATSLLPSLATAQQLPAQTQNEAAAGGRNFPVGTLRGTFKVVQWPEIQLDGQAERGAPGMRIYSAQHMMMMPASLTTGETFDVNYLRGPGGQVSSVWLLSAGEAKAKRAGADRPLLNFWPFVSNSPRDDGRTPYNQLPSYGQ